MVTHKLRVFYGTYTNKFQPNTNNQNYRDQFFFTIILVIKTSNKRNQCVFTRIIVYKSTLLIIRLIDNIFMNIEDDKSIKILFSLRKLGKQVCLNNHEHKLITIHLKSIIRTEKSLYN